VPQNRGIRTNQQCTEPTEVASKIIATRMLGAQVGSGSLLRVVSQITASLRRTEHD